MCNAMPARIRRLMLLTLVTGGALTVPRIAAAQLSELYDPCYEVLSEWGSLQPFTAVVPDDAAKLTDAIMTARGMLRAADKGVWAILAKVDTANVESGLTAVDVERLRRTRRCLDWLRRRIQELDDALSKLGVNVLESPDTRRGRGEPVARKDFVLEFLGSIRKLEGAIDVELRNH